MARTHAELGAIGLPLFAGRLSLERNVNLRGVAGIRIFREMATDEPAATAFLSAAYNLLRTDLQVQPGGNAPADAELAAFVESCLHEMDESLGTILRQCYSMLWAGWDIHEIVYRRRPDGRVGWKTWALRRQESLDSWETDTRGRVTGFRQRPAPTYDLRTLPLTRCLHLVADDSEGSPEGRSALRGMYRQWYFVKNFELLLGISLERFGTGMPVFSREDTVDLSDDQADVLAAIAASVRQNESAYVLEPPGIKFRFEPSPGLDAQTYLDAIHRFRSWMLATVLADFIALGLGQSGSYSLGQDKSELFLLALNGWQTRLTDAINRQLIPRLLRANGIATDTPPIVSLPAVARYDLTKIGSFAQTLAGIGALHVTPADEAMFRRMADFVDVAPEELEELFTQPEPLPAAPMDEDEMPMDEEVVVDG